MDTDETPTDDLAIDELAAESPPAEAVDAAPDETPSDGEAGKHPLEPGGKRWNQLYRRTKDAERELQTSRERLASLETEVRLLRESRQEPQADEKVYTGAELQQAIDEGKITVGTAIDYARRTGQEAAVKQLRTELDQRDQLTRETGTVRGEIDRYVTVLPGLANADSDETRKAYDAYRDLTAVWGEPKSELDKQRLQLTALKTAFGSVASVESRMKAKAAPQSHQETTSGSSGATRARETGENWWNNLSKDERTYYDDLVRRGVYTRDQVKEEVDWYTTKYDRTRKRVMA